MSNWMKEVINFGKKKNLDYQTIFKAIGDNFNKISGGSLRKNKLIGGSLDSKNLKKMLAGTYDKRNKDIGDFKIDKSLSGKRAKVWYNDKNGQSVTAHRGTANLKDWGTNVGMAVGYEKGNRFKHANKVQKQSEKKYGTENMTTIGHSLGGRIAEKYGKNSNEIITLNKAVTPKTMFDKVPNKQYDIRSSSDVVSALQFGQKNRNLTNIKTKSNNPLLEHNTNILNRRGDKSFGKINLNDNNNNVNNKDNNNNLGEGNFIRGQGLRTKK